jgi:diacylglycerol kinase family enzyme
LIRAGKTVRARLFAANGQRFFLFAGAGVDARIVQRVERERERHGYRGGMRRWFIPSWHEFVLRPEVLVTRVRSYAVRMSLPSGIDIGDDRLHVLAFPRRAKLALLATAAQSFYSRLRSGRDAVHIRTEGPVLIEGDPREPFHLDGTQAGHLPVDIRDCGVHARLVIP